MEVSTGSIVSHRRLSDHVVQCKRRRKYVQLASAEHASTGFRQVRMSYFAWSGQHFAL